MSNSKFFYVTYIRTSPQKLWEALIDPEFNRQFWFGMHQECDWKKGASWKLFKSDGCLAGSGEVVEIDPPKRLVLQWRDELRPEMKAEGYTQCTMDIEREGEMVKLTVTHGADKPHKLLDLVSQGWPKVLSSLKSLLETGKGSPRPE